MVDIFSVLADPTRRQILSVLLEQYVSVEPDGAAQKNVSQAPGAVTGEISVSQLVTQLELSQPTVSKHLKVLRDAGLVTVREEGQHRFYTLNSSPLEELEDWLIPFLSADFDDLADDYEDEHELDQFSDASLAVFAAGETVGYTAAETTHRVRALVNSVQSGVQSVVAKVRR